MRFADPAACSQYVQCVDGHLEQRTCPQRSLFDRITKTCKPHEQAECHGAKPDAPIATSTTTTQPSKFIHIILSIFTIVIKTGMSSILSEIFFIPFLS